MNECVSRQYRSGQMRQKIYMTIPWIHGLPPAHWIPPDLMVSPPLTLLPCQ